MRRKPQVLPEYKAHVGEGGEKNIRGDVERKS